MIEILEKTKSTHTHTNEFITLSAASSHRSTHVLNAEADVAGDARRRSQRREHKPLVDRVAARAAKRGVNVDQHAAEKGGSVGAVAAQRGEQRGHTERDRERQREREREREKKKKRKRKRKKRERGRKMKMKACKI